MFSLSLWPVAGSFLLQLSPYLVVALILAAAAWIIIRQFTGRRSRGCCSDGTSGTASETDFPFSSCSNCSGCQAYGCARHPGSPERKDNA
ncbi:MAG: hypothetical protein EOM13_00650 [Clostridia bacterium]|nr:hypothetical protein [Eubacteriales bacterium]MDD3866069.1 hypothetical protein [Eubacteriales bacterium]MDD4460879.1 hypothetical protein [Eubacteriales bacterium]NCC47551.1 hypothetical protein [Clostridia bacterium]